jgi:hypothetical protein
MPEIVFTVDNETGETNLKMTVRGKGCKPIHEAFSSDLNKALGIDELKAEDTEGMRQQATYTNQTSVRTGR